MPLFFFHTQTDTRTSDAAGIELRGAAEARQQAVQTCGEMMRDAPEAFWGTRPWSVVVTDAVGLVLWEIFMDGVSSASAPA